MKKEKVYDLLLFTLMFVAILSTIVLLPLNQMDELWNYNFARNIANGLVPYRDFNIITTPLLPIICGIILKFTFNELIVMRILAALLCSFVLFITCKLFNIVNVKKDISIFFTFILGYLFKDIFCIDYNYASLLLTLIIIYLEIRYYKRNHKFITANSREDILLGLLAGLTFTTKQTSGLLILAVTLGNKLLFVKNKDEFQIYIKSFCYRLIGALIPITVLLIYLIYNNAFVEFIDYTILGILEFNNQLPYRNLFNFDLVGVLSILVPIMFLVGWIKSVILDGKKEEYFLSFYGIAMFGICFPIANKIHFLIGSLPIIIMLLYEIYNFIIKIKRRIFKRTNIDKMILNVFKYIIIVILICYSIINFYSYNQMSSNYCKFKYFRFIPTDDLNFQISMGKVIEFINNNDCDVKILDWLAAIFTIPADTYNKNYDMFNEGNFGYNGNKKIIEEISNSKDTQYLILQERYITNWQAPTEIINYVKNNKKKIGQIEMFDIYE